MNKAIYFKSHGCSVCTSLLPKVESLFKRKFPLLGFEIVQVEEKPEYTASLGVFTAPVLIIFFEGKEHLRLVRNFSIVELESQLSRPYKLLFE